MCTYRPKKYFLAATKETIKHRVYFHSYQQWLIATVLIAQNKLYKLFSLQWQQYANKSRDMAETKVKIIHGPWVGEQDN